MKFSLSQVAAALGAALPPGVADARITGWSVDTRTLEPGDLFFALRGPFHDGHQHIPAAFEKGAVAAVVERPVDSAGTQISVQDSLGALQQLGTWAREQWGGEVVGVTGSAGKTTTKDAIAHLLSAALTVGKTNGNFNNHVGVPLSVLRLPGNATHAVIEIGMNHPGEIRHLVGIALPQVAVVTNVGSAHIENFENGIDGITAAKRELVEALAPSGVAVLNADDLRVARMRTAHQGRTVTFGLSESADVRAEEVEFSPEGARFRVGNVQFETPLSGRHGVSNLVCGIAVAGLYGIAPDRLTEAVRSFTAGKMRGTKIALAGMTIYDDCYNANPDAMRAMIDVLRGTPAQRRIAVLGEMLELGRWAEPLHREIGRYVVESGITVLVGIRGVARQMVDAAIESGMQSNAAYFFQTPEEAGDFLRAFAREGDAILFKGSRGTQVERALRTFLPAQEGAA